MGLWRGVTSSLICRQEHSLSKGLKWKPLLPACARERNRSACPRRALVRGSLPQRAPGCWAGSRPVTRTPRVALLQPSSRGLAQSLPRASRFVLACFILGVPSLSTAEEPIMGFGGVTGGLSAVPWLFFRHLVSVRGSGPKSSLHQAWARGSFVCG